MRMGWDILYFTFVMFLTTNHKSNQYALSADKNENGNFCKVFALPLDMENTIVLCVGGWVGVGEGELNLEQGKDKLQ